MLSRFFRDESGATAIEYGLIIACVSLAIIAGMSRFADSTNELFEYSSDNITEAMQD